jgi:hypothetical protein
LLVSEKLSDKSGNESAENFDDNEFDKNNFDG